MLLEPCKDLTRQEVQRVFSKLLFRSRTIPRLLRTDRGQEFTGLFQEYFAVVGIQQKFSSALRPVEMGACERVQESQKLLGVLVHDVCRARSHEWSELLPVAEFLLAGKYTPGQRDLMSKGPREEVVDGDPIGKGAGTVLSP